MRRRVNTKPQTALRYAACCAVAWTASLGLPAPLLADDVPPPPPESEVVSESLAIIDEAVEAANPLEAQFYWASLSASQDVAPLTPQMIQPDSGQLAESAASRETANVFRGGAARSNLQTGAPRDRQTTAADQVLGIESKVRNTTDAGSLLGASSTSRGVTTQKRNPIISDPRIRGSRVGQVADSGSYWIPARIDLDTMLSKIDSRLIDEVTVVKGPYGVQYGPGFDFLDFQLVTTPRSELGTTTGGSSSLNYQTNGDQWYGRQTGYAAGENWGARVGYGVRSGTDYESGDGTQIPSSYKSRDLDVALGFDFQDGKNLELIYLHQDQTDVELPGQAFDIDNQVTNGVEATWTDREVGWADRFTVETWYNETRLRGSAQRPSKRATFPFLDVIRYTGTTNVNSLSTGAAAKAQWELDVDRVLTAGTDFRLVRQGLDEISSGRFGFQIFDNANSPIPRSASANPGWFAEVQDTSIESLTLTAGVRADVVATEILEDAANLAVVGTGSQPYADILGVSDFDRTFGVWSVYLTSQYELDPNWSINAGAGHGQRPPSLTELYAAESFMFLLQNGLNTVTGDPRLNPERRTQLDLGVTYSDERFRAGITGFHAWVNERITFENTSVRRGPPFGQIEQVNLRYVNTDLARLYGCEANAEYIVAPWISVFSTLNYVEGRDYTRNGSYATLQADGTNPSERVDGVPRGTFGAQGQQLTAHEALPGIPPLENRTGVRLNGEVWDVRWNVELAARIVDSQDRVATSLFESATPGFTTWDLRSHWLVNEHLTFVTGVENFTDKDYREHFDFRSSTGLSVRQPGANFYFGTELTY